MSTFADKNDTASSSELSDAQSALPASGSNNPSAQRAMNKAPNVNVSSLVGGGESSTASSRDTSPCRELSPLVTSLKPPIVIRRGPRGFGFTVHTIRVYYGDTNFYTMHHLVMAVDETSPAFEAGLRPADLITHVNGEPVQGLFHTQVLRLLLNNNNNEFVTLRATPLEHTSIQSGGRKRDLQHTKLAKKSVGRQKKQKKEAERKRKTSLFRRISTKRASAEMQQLSTGMSSPVSVTPSRSCQSFSQPSGTVPPNPYDDSSVNASNSFQKPVPLSRLSLSPLDGMGFPQPFSQPSSPCSSAPSTPTSSPSNSIPIGIGGNHNKNAQIYHPHHHQRPSTLHGLKHKLHSSVIANKSLHHPIVVCSGSSPSNTSLTTPANNRRKSVGHIPLSPLARTPSPSPLPTSPIRSPSPLAFPSIIPGHQPGSSNTTQSYSPNCNQSNSGLNTSSSNSGTLSTSLGMTAPGTLITSTTKKVPFVRSKNAEPGSPLLRRALSPDRLHPRNALEKCSISPLCCENSISNNSSVNVIATGNIVGVKNQRIGTNNVWCSKNIGNRNFVSQTESGSKPFNQGNENFVNNDNNNRTSSISRGNDSSDSLKATIIAGSTTDEGTSTESPSLSMPANPNQAKITPPLTIALQNQSELLPIAEEKDSPTNAGATSVPATVIENKCDVKSKEKNVIVKKNDHPTESNKSFNKTCEEFTNKNTATSSTDQNVAKTEKDGNISHVTTQKFNKRKSPSKSNKK